MLQSVSIRYSVYGAFNVKSHAQFNDDEFNLTRIQIVLPRKSKQLSRDVATRVV